MLTTSLQDNQEDMKKRKNTGLSFPPFFVLVDCGVFHCDCFIVVMLLYESTLLHLFTNITDEDNEPADSTPSRTLTIHSTSSITPNSKRPRTWSNKPQSINISTDILKEMLPTPSSPAEHNADMDDAGARNGNDDAGARMSRTAQQVYSAPSRRDKKEEESAGPREGILVLRREGRVSGEEGEDGVRGVRRTRARLD